MYCLLIVNILNKALTNEILLSSVSRFFHNNNNNKTHLSPKYSLMNHTHTHKIVKQ